MLYLACVYTGELVFLSCLAHSCDLRANPVTCLHVALPRGCLSRVVASIHLITVDAGLRSHGDLHIWDDSFFVLVHFRAAFTMGKKNGATFLSTWGA